MEAVISLNEGLAAKGHLQTSRAFQTVVTAILIYETVLATIAGTHLSPSGSLTCALRERWETMFRGKDSEDIRRIQDAFGCCGFNSPRDMAFPFPSQGHGADTCMVRYDRDTACVDAWRNEERKVAIMLLVIPLAVFLWKVRGLRGVLIQARVLTTRTDHDYCRTFVRLGLAPISHPSAR